MRPPLRFPTSLRAVLAWHVPLVLILLTYCAAVNASDARLVADGLKFPEGTVFAGPTLYFVDYATSSVNRIAQGSVQRVWQRDGCGANGLAVVPGGLLVACYDEGTVVTISRDGETKAVARQDDAGRRFTSPNDFALDSRGGVYFSDSGSASASGGVYFRSADGRIRRVARSTRYANGLAVAPRGDTLYVAESAASHLLAYPIGADGGLGSPREFARLDALLSAPGQAAFTPDGVRIDRRGNLFVGLYRGGGIAVLSDDGKLRKYIGLPGTHHANLALSPDGRTIYVTSADDVADGDYRGSLLAIQNPFASD